MLYLTLGEAVTDIRAGRFKLYFDDAYTDIDYDDPIVQEIVNSIDKPLKYYGKGRWEGRVIGVIGPNGLSGGSKALLCSYMWPEVHYPLEWLGNNCAHGLNVLSEQKDIHWILNNSGFVFEPDQDIFVVDWNEHILGKDMYEELRLHEDGYPKIMQGLHFQIDKNIIESTRTQVIRV